MEVFKKQYFLFNNSLVCDYYQTGEYFKKETDIYNYIARNTSYFFYRTETVGQDGFPDVLLLRGGFYAQIEAKMLRKKQLLRIENDLKFEFGQLPYMQRAFRLGLNYFLVVAKDDTLAAIRSVKNERKFISYCKFT